MSLVRPNASAASLAPPANPAYIAANATIPTTLIGTLASRAAAADRLQTRADLGVADRERGASINAPLGEWHTDHEWVESAEPSIPQSWDQCPDRVPNHLPN
jgi:hypothetical protein